MPPPATRSTSCSNPQDRCKVARCRRNPISHSGLASIRISVWRAGVVPGRIRKTRKSDQPLTDRGKLSQPARRGGYRVLRTAFLAVTLLIAGVCPVLAQDAAAGEKDFLVCRACHQIGPGAKIAVGPVLNGIVGRKAGTYPGYEYSDANKNSGIVWTPDELDKYLTSPQTVVPHTKMIFPGLKDAQKRQDVIAFLQQFGPDGQKKQ